MSADTNPGIYPGNLSLPKEVREKILSTFRHALNLFGEGKIDDCLIGCDFILKMDPRFAPARKLMDKARNPNAEVDIAALEAIVATTPSRQERVLAADTDRLLVRAVESYNARDFDAAIAAAEQVLAVLPGNQDALEIIENSSGKKAAQPLFDASRQRALAALQAKRPDDARRELEQMRGLDPEHPAVSLLERRIGPKAPAPAAPPAASTLDGHFGSETQEPQIAFDSGATVSIQLDPPASPPPPPDPRGPEASDLDALSLDSLSLDIPPPGGAAARPAASAGSATDLWSKASPSPSSEGPASPPPAAPEPEAGGEKDTTMLLKQGDEAAKSGDRQQAIEIWSRIFLIDINNSDAVARIEKARQEMAEGNRVVSDSLKTGREKFEAGDLPAARELFLKVLGVDENEPTARFYLDRIEEQLAHPTPAPEAAAVDARSQPRAAAAPDAAAAPPVRAIRLPFNPKVLGLVSAFVLLTLAGVYYFVFRGPKPQSHAARATAPAGGLEHAKQLLASAKVGEARKELSGIPPGHPDYAQAQKMLAELPPESASVAPSGSGPASSAGSASSGPVPPSAHDPAVIRATAEKAFAEKRYIEALKGFNLAAPAYRDDPTFAHAMGVAAEKVGDLTPAVKLYNEGEYDTAIPILWRITQDDHDNQDARSYLQRAYFNQGVTQLQNGLIEKAAQSFGEALGIDPTDAGAIRNKKFAERYRKGDLDLMGRIYVRHLSHRP